MSEKVRCEDCKFFRSAKQATWEYRYECISSGLPADIKFSTEFHNCPNYEEVTWIASANDEPTYDNFAW